MVIKGRRCLRANKDNYNVTIIIRSFTSTCHWTFDLNSLLHLWRTCHRRCSKWEEMPASGQRGHVHHLRRHCELPSLFICQLLLPLRLRLQQRWLQSPGADPTGGNHAGLAHHLGLHYLSPYQLHPCNRARRSRNHRRRHYLGLRDLRWIFQYGVSGSGDFDSNFLVRLWRTCYRRSSKWK